MQINNQRQAQKTITISSDCKSCWEFSIHFLCKKLNLLIAEEQKILGGKRIINKTPSYKWTHKSQSAKISWVVVYFEGF